MKFFKRPEMEIEKIEIEDVITTSGEKDPDEGGGDPI